MKFARIQINSSISSPRVGVDGNSLSLALIPHNFRVRHESYKSKSLLFIRLSAAVLIDIYYIRMGGIITDVNLGYESGDEIDGAVDSLSSRQRVLRFHKKISSFFCGLASICFRRWYHLERRRCLERLFSQKTDRPF